MCVCEDGSDLYIQPSVFLLIYKFNTMRGFIFSLSQVLTEETRLCHYSPAFVLYLLFILRDTNYSKLALNSLWSWGDLSLLILLTSLPSIVIISALHRAQCMWCWVSRSGTCSGYTPSPFMLPLRVKRCHNFSFIWFWYLNWKTIVTLKLSVSHNTISSMLVTFSIV